ncbi:hypothetical protein Pmani_017004 [Petrolisthes manimaculis]|uniref:Uncharacterized protein n=1 Tax=Petrolisthes manimaculis TaxID=1843537 RepID=A0AAE1PNU5_9EUCA|nr:hypothetical protein Pmani_017004 [Petrolisthes manimaculis]
MLDLIFCNDELLIEDVMIQSHIGKSDHGCFVFSCDLEVQHKNIEKLVYMMEKADWGRLKELMSIDWKEYLYLQGVDEVWNKFKTKLCEDVEACIPRRKFREGMNRNSPAKYYQNVKLKSKIKKKRRLWNRLKQLKTSGVENYDGELSTVSTEYKRVNNQVRSATRKEANRKDKIIAENVKDNPKIFWKAVQAKTKSTRMIPELYIDESKVEKTKGDQEKAEVLSDFYCSVFTEEPTGVPAVETKEVPKLEDITFTEEMIKTKIDGLKRNKSSGPDGIHVRVIK